MSKDFTPQELHMVDRTMNFSKKRIALQDDNGNEMKILYDPEAPFARQLPNLYFLFTDFVDSLTDEYGSKVVPILEKVEQELTGIIEKDDAGLQPADTESIVYLWYKGKLDHDFYYNTWNNELFREYIVNAMREMPAESCGGTSREVVFIYKEYNDEKSYGEEVLMWFPTKEEAVSHLKERVEACYGPLDDLRKDPLFENDTLNDDYVSVENDGGDVSYFIVETLEKGQPVDR